RMDYLMEALPGLGFVLPVKPRGAFYVYADCSGLTRDSFSFCDEVLEQAGVVITPGRDFGDNQPERHVRFSCTSNMEQLKAGIQRLQAYLSSCP
ncbi:MAG: aminotransferase, partial [Gammaproteobacteria bacterium]